MTSDNDSAAFQTRLWLSSVQLVRVDTKDDPTGIASGALVDYRGKRLLLTAEHATRDQARWAIQVRYVPGNGTELYGLGAMNFLKSVSMTTKKVKTVDLAYVSVPHNIRPVRQEIDPASATIKRERPITIHTPSLTDVPSGAGNYGFCGMVLAEVEEHPDRTFFGGEIRIYPGLKFVRTEEDFHYFALPFAHPGHEHFQGCSGAPVLDEKGGLVGLVSGGDISTNEIWVLSLHTYRAAIDILVGNVH